MKIFKKNYALAAILLLLFAVKSYSQDPEAHYITLYVDTSIINSQNENEVSNFGQTTNVSNEDYTIDVRLGDTIIWRGVSSVSDEDVVNITAINYEGGVNIFNRNVLRGDNGDPEQVTGTVVTGNVGDMIKYKVSFTVYRNGSKLPGTFKIDPKIRLKT